MTKEQQDEINDLKELIADDSTPADLKQIFIDGLAELEKNIGEKPQATEKPQTTQRAKQTTKPKKAITKKAKAVKKATPLPSDVDAMKKAIKERTGKTEAECEDIIAQYRKLRAKAKVNNAKRTEKLKTDDKLITGTNVITPVAQIEKDAEIVKAKIEKQVEQIENKAEREVVKKDKTKDEVKVEVEKKVVKELTKLSDEMVASATTFVKNIQTELKKVDKTEAKKFLLGLRNEIDALLSKFSDGGILQTYNIAENMSVSSVNPSKFAKGGNIGEDLENYSNYNEFYNVVFDYIKREENLTEEETKDICIVNESIIEGEFDNGSSPRFTGDVVLGYLSNERAYKRGGGVRTGSDGREYPFGSAWALEHNKHNKKENYEIPTSSRKMGMGGETKNDYVVNVGNIGNITCDSLLEARMMYNEYVEQSKSGMGRAGNEYVGLYENGEPIMEYFGTLDNDNEYKRGGGVRTGSDGREYPFGSAWALEHNKHNKKENYEIPTSSRKG